MKSMIIIFLVCFIGLTLMLAPIESIKCPDNDKGKVAYCGHDFGLKGKDSNNYYVCSCRGCEAENKGTCTYGCASTEFNNAQCIAA